MNEHAITIHICREHDKALSVTRAMHVDARANGINPDKVCGTFKVKQGVYFGHACMCCGANVPTYKVEITVFTYN